MDRAGKSIQWKEKLEGEATLQLENWSPLMTSGGSRHRNSTFSASGAAPKKFDVKLIQIRRGGRLLANGHPTLQEIYVNWIGSAQNDITLSTLFSGFHMCGLALVAGARVFWEKDISCWSLSNLKNDRVCQTSYFSKFRTAVWNPLWNQTFLDWLFATISEPG